MKEIDLKNIDPSLLNQLEIVATQDQISRDLDGEAVILNTKTGVYCSLNQVGARIWQLIQKPAKLIELRGILIMEYNIEPEQCEREVLAFLKEMAGHSLIEITVEKNG